MTFLSYRRRFGVTMAAALGLLLLGVMLGAAAAWTIASFPADEPASGRPEQLAHRAVLAHRIYAPEVRHPVEVRASEKAHLSAWLSKRLEADMRPPDLAGSGFALLGGRLLPGEPIAGPAPLPAAQFMYENANSRRVTLYVRNTTAKQRSTQTDHSPINAVEVFHWADGRLEYALASGDVSASELSALAEEARRGRTGFGMR